ncbi:MAG TPA: DOMON-like domain-containing protein [Steroidobacteraceae bacterium]|nr:DOMON-like domain-containing protein [Steroidobacteraceae bacterium]
MSAIPGPAVALIPFAADPPCAVRGIEVRVARPEPATLVLEYELLGNLAGVRIGDGAPARGAMAGPTDGLWRHTCMEVFVAHAPPGHYLEFNLAPTGQWAAYRFSGYRSGMAPLGQISAPRIELRTRADRLLLSAAIELPADLTGALRLGITTVVEDTQGRLGYWALHHAGERPDFHHPDSFTFEI